MDNWNADSINEVFIRRANERNPARYLNKPKNDVFADLMQVEIALHDINWHCAHNCRQKTALISFLDSVPTLPFCNKPTAYVEAYISAANDIKKLILSGELI